MCDTFQIRDSIIYFLYSKIMICFSFICVKLELVISDLANTNLA
ncbi:hypothetical protein LEP1GSC170_2826 [Leptospira interrogans serovar Bataviae str. HAI135]|nr:hypothetical protein LEP1GSC170_2826 [Leptospira interrogans serovar Bataviae str. HAI135]